MCKVGLGARDGLKLRQSIWIALQTDQITGVGKTQLGLCTSSLIELLKHQGFCGGQGRVHQLNRHHERVFGFPVGGMAALHGFERAGLVVCSQAQSRGHDPGC